MNLWIVTPLIRALRGKSLTAAVLFASGLLGLSIAGVLREAAGGLGLSFLQVWLLPMVVFAALARYERALPIRPELKRFLVMLLVAGSIVLSTALWRYEAHMDSRYPEPERLRGPAFDRRLGPRGK